MPKQTTTYRLPKKLIEKIRKKAKEDSMSMSDVVRFAVKQYLESNK